MFLLMAAACMAGGWLSTHWLDYQREQAAIAELTRDQRFSLIYDVQPKPPFGGIPIFL